jgi:hypothetical protein
MIHGNRYYIVHVGYKYITNGMSNYMVFYTIYSAMMQYAYKH